MCVCVGKYFYFNVRTLFTLRMVWIKLTGKSRCRSSKKIILLSFFTDSAASFMAAVL